MVSNISTGFIAVPDFSTAGYSPFFIRTQQVSPGSEVKSKRIPGMAISLEIVSIV